MQKWKSNDCSLCVVTGQTRTIFCGPGKVLEPWSHWPKDGQGSSQHHRKPLADTFDSDSPKASAHELPGCHKTSNYGLRAGLVDESKGDLPDITSQLGTTTEPGLLTQLAVWRSQLMWFKTRKKIIYKAVQLSSHRPDQENSPHLHIISSFLIWGHLLVTQAYRLFLWGVFF